MLRRSCRNEMRNAMDGNKQAAQTRPDMRPRGHEQMLQEMHQGTIWALFVNIMLGVWLIAAPFTLGYFTEAAGIDAARVTAERGLPSVLARNQMMAWSDIISGALIVVFGFLSLSRRFSWAQWATAAVGFWLLFAPLVFWAPTPVAYLNDTLIGALVIGFSVLIPMMPGMSMEGMMGGPDVPPGWDYCPSTPVQRAPIIGLAFASIPIAIYLTAFQMGYIPRAWDPFFGEGTMTIITSDVSKAWPIPDAGLGVVSYILEVLMGLMGDKRRWRTMPWMVLAFIVLVVPLGVVSIFFIIIQPIVIGTWCTPCLVAALFMLVMIPFALDELVAMGQFLAQSKRDGKSLLRTFFMGDAMRGGGPDQTQGFHNTPAVVARDMARGVTVPWTLLLSCAIGVWLMFTRLIYGTSGSMADSDHLIGALAITVAVIAMAEVARPVRFINILFGLWLIAAPWVLDGASTVAAAGSIAAGIGLVLLSLPKGPIEHRYAAWDRLIV